MGENTTFKEEHTTLNIGMDEYEEQTIHCSPNDSIKKIDKLLMILKISVQTIVLLIR